MTTRLSITIPDELKERIDEYNENNPYDKISPSKVAQWALNEKLNSARGASNC